ncbi:UTP--glucose-1-phosphate uridylyltransferase [Candidatus Peregrinibacteria bacterium]|nr:MAG: UTP--glucose-1-phosphate uridylyltransferase [Candidatus Peregrinibacteria bacterium]
MKPIKKVVILAAGLGTRFLPMTKAIPKAMLPILDKPVIQYLVEEALDSGIQEIIIVTGMGKRAIEEHFDHSYELEHELRSRGKLELLETMERIEKKARFAYVRQENAHGDGHAILCAKDVLGEEPFAVLFGDDLVDGPRPALRQLLDIYEKTGNPVLCVETVSLENISNYGVIQVQNQEDRLIHVAGLIEKPRPEEAPSSYGIIGKYICTPQVLKNLEQSESSHPDGEIRLIDGLLTHLEQGGQIDAWQVEGTRYDTGTPLGLLEANLAFAKKDPELKAKLSLK